MGDLLEIVRESERDPYYKFVVHLQNEERDELWEVWMNASTGIGTVRRVEEVECGVMG